MALKIEGLSAREILDSRGYPTVEVDLQVSGQWVRASVPSGASTGSHEALELRDGEEKRYLGKGVRACLGHLKTLTSKLFAEPFESPEAFDRWLIAEDGTENKSKFGANTLLPLSMAMHRAAASVAQKPLFEYLHETYFKDRPLITPIPMMNVINGGKHADNGIQIQEFMVCPRLSDEASMGDRIRAGAEIYHHLKRLLKQEGYSTNVGDEGGFAPNLADEQEALSIISEATTQAGYQLGTEVYLALDSASNEFFEDEKYLLHQEFPPMTSDALIEKYNDLLEQFPALISFEDALQEDDWDSWKRFTDGLKESHPHVMVVGDDLLVTHPKRLKRAIDGGNCNAILIKINQIGTISETAETMNQAFASNFQTVVSHRSGETEDPFIAHLVTGSGAGWLKSGAPCRTDRTSKYNELLRIFN